MLVIYMIINFLYPVIKFIFMCKEDIKTRFSNFSILKN